MYYVIDSSFWFDTTNLGVSIIYIEGLQIIISKRFCISFSEDSLYLSK